MTFTNGTAPLEQVKLAMQRIGYKDDLLVENYEYADILGSYQVKNVNLAGFASIPYSYRNACLGVVTANGLPGHRLVNKHLAFGAPFLFIITQDSLEGWKVAKNGEPQRKECVPHSQIANLFNENASVWKPDSIFRAKVIGQVEAVPQLDFFDVGLMPMLEGMAHKKLDRLLKEALKEIEEAYKTLIHTTLDYKDLYRLVFRLIVAKVMLDRKHLNGVRSDEASTILGYIEKYYKLDNTPILLNISGREKLIEIAWKAISGQFHFQNLSVDDLAFVYEDSFVTDTNRSVFGTHSTPPRIAEYLVQKLSFDEVAESERYVLEPCAGHGAFLVPALRRLRELLPSTFTSEEKHKYLTERLTGIEIDSFAIEACWSRLVLADYPHPNGWDLKEDDVFKGDTLARELEKAQILFCNPPFEPFTDKERAYYGQVTAYKPAEILKRIMSNPPRLLGLLLPQIFGTGQSYHKFHTQLAETYDVVEFIALPEIFKHSEATSMLVLASGYRRHHAPVLAKCRKVDEGLGLDNFLNRGIEPSEARQIFGVEDYMQPNFSLWVAPLSRIWDYLKNKPKIGASIAEIHQGLKWKRRNDKKERPEVSETCQAGYVEGYPKVKGHLKQYLLQNLKFLSLKPEDQATGAYLCDWTKPKVVFNAARLSRTKWRLGATADDEGFAFNKQFFVMWLNEQVSVYAMAALLNSPIANAYVFAHAEGRDNHARIVKSIPIPSVTALKIGGEIDRLSKDLHQQLKRSQFGQAQATILRLDAEILREYDLPPFLERELLDLFQGITRPVPFDFNGYYPENFTAYLPLHEITSDDFQQARANFLLERMPFLDDPEITEALSILQ